MIAGCNFENKSCSIHFNCEKCEYNNHKEIQMGVIFNIKGEKHNFSDVMLYHLDNPQLQKLITDRSTEGYIEAGIQHRDCKE